MTLKQKRKSGGGGGKYAQTLATQYGTCFSQLAPKWHRFPCFTYKLHFAVGEVCVGFWCWRGMPGQNMRCTVKHIFTVAPKLTGLTGGIL